MYTLTTQPKFVEIACLENRQKATLNLQKDWIRVPFAGFCRIKGLDEVDLQNMAFVYIQDREPNRVKIID